MDVIRTPNAPEAIGPYSQAIRTGNFLFLSGQIPLDPATMQVVEGGIQAQTEQVFENMKGVLAAAGASLNQVVKTTVFLADMGEFTPMNEVYARHFGEHRPARSTVQAAGLPKGVSVEIEAIAVLSD